MLLNEKYIVRGAVQKLPKVFSLLDRMETKALFLCFMLLFVNINLHAAKYAGEIFKMGAGVRNFALGRTGLTDVNTPALAYWNASLLLRQTYNTFELMHAQEFNGLLKYDSFSGSWGENHRIGFTLSRIAINNVPMTRLPDPADSVHAGNRPYRHRSVNNSDYILYLGLAGRIGSFPIGMTPKFVYRTLANETAFGFGVDIATHFKPNDIFMFGIRVRDAVPTQIYWRNGTTESVNTGVDLEMQISAKMPVIGRPLNLFINGEINTEAIKKNSFVNIGDVSLDPHLGAELVLHPMVSFFTGYDIEFFTAGIGINYNNLLLNYAFEQNSYLDNSHRFSIGVKIK